MVSPIATWCDTAPACQSMACSITAGVIGGSYLLISIISLFMMIRPLLWFSRGKRTFREILLSNRSLLLQFVFLSSLGRAIQFTLQLTLSKLFQYRAPVLIAEIIPSMLFVSLELLLIYFWAEIYHRARSSTSRASPAPAPSSSSSSDPRTTLIDQTSSFRYRRAVFGTRKCMWWTFIIFNCIVWLVLIVFVALLAWHDRRREDESWGPLEIAVISWDVLMYTTCAVGFILYGGSLFLRLKKIPIPSSRRTRNLRWVGIVTVICTTAFALRSLFVLLQIFCVRLGNSFWIFLIYFGIFEMLPIILLLCVVHLLGQGFSNVKETSINSDNNHHDNNHNNNHHNNNNYNDRESISLSPHPTHHLPSSFRSHTNYNHRRERSGSGISAASPADAPHLSYSPPPITTSNNTTYSTYAILGSRHMIPGYNTDRRVNDSFSTDSFEGSTETSFSSF